MEARDIPSSNEGDRQYVLPLSKDRHKPMPTSIQTYTSIYSRHHRDIQLSTGPTSTLYVLSLAVHQPLSLRGQPAYLSVINTRRARPQLEMSYSGSLDFYHTAGNKRYSRRKDGIVLMLTCSAVLATCLDSTSCQLFEVFNIRGNHVLEI
jgi:hypothetical protein